MSACAVCEANAADLGQPSRARWVGPDGQEYCSLHFINRFGHGEKLVLVENYEPPAEVKAPAPKEEKNGTTA
jgi:hypothetical protein